MSFGQLDRSDWCCIDKSSSAELSEAINSMFKWYENATVCFAYLDDVDAASVRKPDDPSFAQARWFTRGWTLQELIAPPQLDFYSPERNASSWQYIGNRFLFSDAISSITGVPALNLNGGALRHASVAQKMSWASRRETTRKEDVAYCLLGLFDINMPLLYGEGDKAFIRLQEEILRSSADQSLFAWGMHPLGTGEKALAAQILDSELFAFLIPSESEFGGLFAASPSDFLYCSSVKSYFNDARETIETTDKSVRFNTALIQHVGPLSWKLRLQFAIIKCYDDTLANEIAIPLYRTENGDYWRIRSSTIGPVRVSVLKERDSLSTFPLRLQKQHIVVPKHQPVLSVAHAVRATFANKDVVTLRRTCFESSSFCDIRLVETFPPEIWSADGLFSLGPLRFFPILFKPIACTCSIVISIDASLSCEAPTGFLYDKCNIRASGRDVAVDLEEYYPTPLLDKDAINGNLDGHGICVFEKNFKKSHSVSAITYREDNLDSVAKYRNSIDVRVSAPCSVWH